MPVIISARYKAGDFDLDLNLQTDAKRIGILGASGAGKSLTLKLIAGILKADEGRICIDDRVLFDSGKRIDLKPQKRKVGYLFQNYALFPAMTVAENIGIGMPCSGTEKDVIIADLVRQFRLEGLEDHFPRQLSGGQQQRVALARILAAKPDVILLDEPFSALDIHLRDRMNRELLTTLESYPGQVIMVSHSRDEIYRFSDEVVIIDQGRIIDQGPKKEVFAHPASMRAAALTGCKNFCRAKRIDDHCFEAVDWGVRICTDRLLPEKLAFIGYRAHEFEPVWGQRQENCLPFILSRRDELPFETNYYICPSGKETSSYSVAAWFVQRNLWSLLEEKGLPDYLQIKEDSLLFFGD